ncbi:penicillin-binding protein 2 [Candidatus Saccharibacteria bacterium]|nr:penicillin-binding protein 2 [Candidatus Saccharibacteria bacterium]
MKLELQKGSRSKILSGLVIIAMAVFVIRLFYLQILQHNYYVDLAKGEQEKRLIVPAKRGLIYGLDGSTPIPLVMNQNVYTVFADPKVVTDKSKIIDTVQKVAGGNARSDLSGLLDKKDTRYQILATKLTRTQADMIKAANLSGVGFQEESQRVYPEGSLAAQVLGFVSSDGVGKYGVEGELDDDLSGKDGLLVSVTDVNDVPLTIGRDNIDIPAQNGKNIVLSIDRNIQSHIQQALADGLSRTGATRGSVVVMNPQNGQVMAMANLPSYDPSKYNQVEDIAVFNNGVVSTPYEPGSDVKTFTMATGIDKGVVSASDTYNNTDYITVDDRTITNATLGHTGNITFQYALNWSLNTGFVTVAERLGDGKSINLQARNTMYDYFYNRFKLGQLTGVELSNEAEGTVIPPSDSQGNAVRYSNMAFGQGLDVTMVQVASAFCSIANGGNYYKPTVIAGTIDSSGKFVATKTAVASQPISSTTAQQVREMAHVARSTFFSSVDKAGYYTGGKTGTSQVIKNGTYASDETIATYLGFGGTVNESKYVIMVQISGDHKELQGARDALPIFTDISNWMLDYLKVQPKG